MTALDAILLGFEAELGLERELGNRIIPIDRSLLEPLPTAEPVLTHGLAQVYDLRDSENVSGVSREQIRVLNQPTSKPCLSCLFLHHRPLSPKAQAMMERIYAAMKLDASRVRLVTEAPLPDADKVVVLGGLALKKFLPGVQCQPGSWVKAPWGGGHALVTYSPEYILRFSEGSREQLAAKRQLWTALQSAVTSPDRA